MPWHILLGKIREKIRVLSTGVGSMVISISSSNVPPASYRRLVEVDSREIYILFTARISVCDWLIDWPINTRNLFVRCFIPSFIRARNNDWSTNNVRLELGIDRTNAWIAELVVRSFALLSKLILTYLIITRDIIRAVWCQYCKS